MKAMEKLIKEIDETLEKIDKMNKVFTEVMKNKPQKNDPEYESWRKDHELVRKAINKLMNRVNDLQKEFLSSE